MAKISFDYVGIQPSFSTATELRDALLASYPGADFFGGPFTGVPAGRDFTTAPAWGWMKQLLRTRTDWWPAAGIALQHAAQDGGELARKALADLLESCEESAVLLEWTEPLAAQWPDVRTSGSKGVGDERLGDLVDRHRVFAERATAPFTIPGMPVRHAKIGEDIESLLADTIEAIATGPWSWLVSELVHRPWMRPLMPSLCEKLGGGDNRALRSVLDWFLEEHDLWRHCALLERWNERHPAWWDEPIKPGRGRRSPIRKDLVGEAEILGHLVWRALASAVGQRETPPVIDLEPNPSAPRVPAQPPPSIAFTPHRAPIVPLHVVVRETPPVLELEPKPSPPAPPPPPTLDRAITFAQHRAAIRQLLVVDRECVVSVDSDRVAFVWDPRTGAVISRHDLAPHAITHSLSSTNDGVAYVVQDADGIAVHALDDHRVLARISKRDLPVATMAHCTRDFSRVLLASDGDLVLVSLVGDVPVVRKEVESHDPEVLALEPHGDDYFVRFFHVGQDMYPTEDTSLFHGSTLDEIERLRPYNAASPIWPRPSLRVEISDAIARVSDVD